MGCLNTPSEKLLAKLIVQVVDATYGNDIERLCIQHTEVAIKAVDSACWFNTNSSEFQLLAVFCCTFNRVEINYL